MPSPSGFRQSVHIPPTPSVSRSVSSSMKLLLSETNIITSFGKFPFALAVTVTPGICAFRRRPCSKSSSPIHRSSHSTSFFSLISQTMQIGASMSSSL